MSTRRVKAPRSRPDSTTEKLARRFAELKKTERDTEDERKPLGKDLVASLEAQGRKRIKVAYDDELDATVTIKTRENQTIDEKALRKALGAKVFDKLTTAVLDESKLEAAIKLGEVDANVVASCTNIGEPTKFPEVRFTRRRKTP